MKDEGTVDCKKEGCSYEYMMEHHCSCRFKLHKRRKKDEARPEVDATADTKGNGEA